MSHRSSTLITAVILAIPLMASFAVAQNEEATPAQGTQQPSEQQPSEGDELKAVTVAYENAFNAHDAAALGKLWTENGVHIDRETGVKTKGREAIQKDLEDAFAAQAESRISINVNEVRMIQPTVARAEGIATVVAPDQEPGDVAFSVILVRQEDAWLIDSIEESAVPQPESSRDALQALAWLEGDWADQTENVASTSSFTWSVHGAFLVRRFKTQLPEQEETEGTQIIGWDPRSRQIRSWTFHSDGSFGEANWSRNGEDWMVKSTQTLADGGVASGTYVITPVDNDTMKIALIGHEVNGDPLPAIPPVTVARVQVEEEVSAAAEGGDQ